MQLVFLEFTKIILVGGWADGFFMNSPELFDLTGECSTNLTEYPTNIASATGQLMDDKIVICGGTPRAGISTNRCYQLKHGNDSFQLVYSMKMERWHCDSILLQGNMLVTGGENTHYQKSDTGEYINQQLGNNSAPKPDIHLPEPIMGHSLIKINESTLFLVGGFVNQAPNIISTNKTHYWMNDKNQWRSGPDLKNMRGCHTAGLLIDHATNTKIVAVVGGEPHCCDGVAIDSVELLIQDQNDWITGIEFLYSFESSKIPKILQKLFCRSTFTQSTYPA